MHRLGSLAAALAATLNLSVAAAPFNPTRSGHNTVFIHADGVGLAQWTIARAYWKGPDGQLNWDRLPQMAVYRGHLRDSLVASSNGGATTHAFGVKAGAGSFGRDAAGRRLTALSGYAGSLWREAAVRGHPVGLLNDGHLAEPGTAAFAAELDSRRDWNGAALQLLAGRDGASVGRSGMRRAACRASRSRSRASSRFRSTAWSTGWTGAGRSARPDPSAPTAATCCAKRLPPALW